MSYTAGALATFCDQSTWRVVRTVLALDGVAISSSAVMLCALGPPPSYPDGTFEGTILRGASTFFLALLFSPARRMQIAAMARSLGWAHVTIPLSHSNASSLRGDVKAASSHAH